MRCNFFVHLNPKQHSLSESPHDKENDKVDDHEQSQSDHENRCADVRATRVCLVIVEAVKGCEADQANEEERRQSLVDHEVNDIGWQILEDFVEQNLVISSCVTLDVLHDSVPQKA